MISGGRCQTVDLSKLSREALLSSTQLPRLVTASCDCDTAASRIALVTQVIKNVAESSIARLHMSRPTRLAYLDEKDDCGDFKVSLQSLQFIWVPYYVGRTTGACSAVSTG